MSKRETVLCDVEVSNWNNNSVTCGELSIATCVLCKRDMCNTHALHPKGGLLLRADSITPNTIPGQQQDFIYAPNSGQQMAYPQVNMQTPMARLKVCTGCRRGLNDDDIAEAIHAIEGQFVKLLAAAMSAKALAKTTK